MTKKFIFNENAGNGSGIITAASSAAFRKVLSDIREGKGPSDNPPGLVEALVAHSQTQINTDAGRIEIARSTIIMRAAELPLKPGKIEVAHEIPANLAQAFSTALSNKTSVAPVDMVLAEGAMPEQKPAPKGLILPAKR